MFRQKSLDSINSPEQLTEYLRVTTPGIWAILAAVIILLGGLFAWSMVGELETLSYCVTVVKDGTAQITVTDMRSEIRSDLGGTRPLGRAAAENGDSPRARAGPLDNHTRRSYERP